MKTHSFCWVLDNSPKSQPKLCFSAKYTHQEISWNYKIFCNGSKYMQMKVSRNFSFLSIRKSERFNLILSTIEKFKFSNFIESFQIQTSKNRAITTKNRAITTKNRAITTNNRAITTKTARSKEGIINYFQDWVRNYYSPWEWTLLHYSFMFKYYRSPVKEMMLSSTYIFSYSNKSFASVIKRYLFGS